MFNYTFYHEAIKKSVILFGTLFNDIHIERLDASNNIIQQIKVPISYGPKDKFLLKTDSDPELSRKYATLLPRMGFEILSYQYDGNRKMKTIDKIKSKDKSTYHWNPVPYNLMFNLYINVKNVDDGTRIVEQILPFFTPDWTSSVELVPGYDSYDIPLILNSVTNQDNYDSSYEERRQIFWELNFTMKTYLFGPEKSALSKIIKLANTNFYIPITNTAAEGIGITDWSERVTIIPGQDANGNATSNTLINIPYQNTSPNNPFDYIITIDRNE